MTPRLLMYSLGQPNKWTAPWLCAAVSTASFALSRHMASSPVRKYITLLIQLSQLWAVQRMIFHHGKCILNYLLRGDSLALNVILWTNVNLTLTILIVLYYCYFFNKVFGLIVPVTLWHLVWFCLNLQQKNTQLLSHSFLFPGRMGRRIRSKKGKNLWVGMRTV